MKDFSFANGGNHAIYNTSSDYTSMNPQQMRSNNVFTGTTSQIYDNSEYKEIKSTGNESRNLFYSGEYYGPSNRFGWDKIKNQMPYRSKNNIFITKHEGTYSCLKF